MLLCCLDPLGKRAKRVREGKRTNVCTFRGVLLLLAAVVPGDEVVGGRRVKIKDALYHGLRFGTKLMGLGQMVPKLFKVSQERQKIDFSSRLGKAERERERGKLFFGKKEKRI